MLPGNQKGRETASQRQALDNVRRSIERKKAEAERVQVPVNYAAMRDRELQGQTMSDSPQAKELEKFADFFMQETENLRKFGDFGLQDGEQPRSAEDDERQR